MNRTTRTVVKIFLIAAATVLCIAAAYYLGANVTGHKLATASDNMNYSRWLEKYFALTRAAGLLNGLCALGWFLTARFFFHGRRGVGRGQENFLGGVNGSVFGDKFGRRAFLRTASRNKTQRNNFRSVRNNLHGLGLLAVYNFHDAARLQVHAAGRTTDFKKIRQSRLKISWSDFHAENFFIDNRRNNFGDIIFLRTDDGKKFHH